MGYVWGVVTERKYRLNVMVSGHELSVLKALAQSVGISASAYVRALILREARRGERDDLGELPF